MNPSWTVPESAWSSLPRVAITIAPAAKTPRPTKNPLYDGVTFSGGDPMDQAEALVPYARAIKERGLNLVIFTGYTYERLMELSASRPGFFELLSFADILIDGPFIMAKKSLELKFRGSSNQRIIDVQKSLVEGHVVLHKIQLEEMAEHPDWHFG